MGNVRIVRRIIYSLFQVHCSIVRAIRREVLPRQVAVSDCPLVIESRVVGAPDLLNVVGASPGLDILVVAVRLLLLAPRASLHVQALVCEGCQRWCQESRRQTHCWRARWRRSERCRSKSAGTSRRSTATASPRRHRQGLPRVSLIARLALLRTHWIRRRCRGWA